MSIEADTAKTGRVRRPVIDMGEHLGTLAIVSALGWVVQLIATDAGPVAAAIGMLTLYVICVIGVALAKWMPFYLPSVAWISLVGIVATLPFVPGSDAVVSLVTPIDFLALTVPCLAYAGLAITKDEISVVKTSGWKLLLVAIFVLFGTYLGSVLIADLMLGVSGG